MSWWINKTLIACNNETDFDIIGGELSSMWNQNYFIHTNTILKIYRFLDTKHVDPEYATELIYRR